MAFRPYSRQDIIARLKGTSLGGISGNYDPRKTHWENAGTQDVLGREETDWPDTTFGKSQDDAPYTPPSPGMGGINPLDPAAALPEQYSPASTYNPDMAIPGVGSFIYGPGNMVMQNIIPQARFWPHNYAGKIGGDDYHDPDRPSHVGVDLRNFRNDPVYAGVEGTISGIQKDPSGPAGNYIMVQDKYGNLHGHAHTGTVEGLATGTVVKAGQKIGVSNGTGLTPQGKPIAPHLHYTYRQGTPTAPATMSTPYSDPNLIFQQLRGRPIGWNPKR